MGSLPRREPGVLGSGSGGPPNITPEPWTERDSRLGSTGGEPLFPGAKAPTRGPAPNYRSGQRGWYRGRQRPSHIRGGLFLLLS